MEKEIKTKEPEKIDFIDLVKVLFNEKFIVIFIVSSFVIFSSINVYMKKPEYTSSMNLISAYYDNIILQPYSEMYPHMDFYAMGIDISDLKNGYLRLTSTSNSIEENNKKLIEAYNFFIDDSKQKIDKHTNNHSTELFMIQKQISAIESEMDRFLKIFNEDVSNSELQIFLSNLRLELSNYLMKEKLLEDKLSNPDLFKTTKQYNEIESYTLKSNKTRKILSFAILGFIFSILIIFVKKALIISKMS